MNPFYFGNSETPLFGIHHSPKDTSYTDTSVVLCNPIGSEYIISHHAMKTLAARLSKQGYHVLRFDYFSQGDSSGDSNEGSVQHWLEDIKTACNEIRDISANKKITLIGLRFGATLASYLSQELKINQLVLWEPVIDGKDYLNKLQLMHDEVLLDESRFENIDDITSSDEELIGCPFTETLKNEIHELSLINLSKSKAKKIELIMPNSDTNWTDLLSHFEGISKYVNIHETDDTGDWENMSAIENIFLPNQTIDQISNRAVEKTFLFGKNRNLIGILSQPSENNISERPVVLILNAGLVHRPGPFRINTELSREIMKEGYTVLRFDQSGIGDSEKIPQDRRTYAERNLDDVGEALDCIKEKCGDKKVIVIGLCTGADYAHKAASKYDVITGAVLLDGYGYPTTKFYIKRYLPILFAPKRIFNLLLKLLSKVLPFIKTTGENGVEAYFWELPPKNSYIEDMERLSKNNTRHLYVYTGGVIEYYNYENQFHDAFKEHDFRKTVDVIYNGASDHTYILQSHRMKLFKDIKNWINKNFSQ